MGEFIYLDLEEVKMGAPGLGRKKYSGEGGVSHLDSCSRVTNQMMPGVIFQHFKQPL